MKSARVCAKRRGAIATVNSVDRSLCTVISSELASLCPSCPSNRQRKLELCTSSAANNLFVFLFAVARLIGNHFSRLLKSVGRRLSQFRSTSALLRVFVLLFVHYLRHVYERQGMATNAKWGTFSTEHSSSVIQPLLHAEVLHSDLCESWRWSWSSIMNKLLHFGIFFHYIYIFYWVYSWVSQLKMGNTHLISFFIA